MGNQDAERPIFVTFGADGWRVAARGSYDELLENLELVVPAGVGCDNGCGRQATMYGFVNADGGYNKVDSTFLDAIDQLDGRTPEAICGHCYLGRVGLMNEARELAERTGR